MWKKHKRRKTKANPDIYHTLNRVEIWWEDAVSHDTWKDIDEARKDSLAVCFTEADQLNQALSFSCTELTTLVKTQHVS